jgi:hypothetical protein
MNFILSLSTLSIILSRFDLPLSRDTIMRLSALSLLWQQSLGLYMSLGICELF